MTTRRHLLSGILIMMAGMVPVGALSHVDSQRNPVHTKISTPANCGNTSVGLTPINDLGTGTYNGYEGGLYPNGSNQVPRAYLQTGLSQAALIQPLDANGHPSLNGQIVLLSIGMSNAQLEYTGFQTAADSDPLKSSYVHVVNAAQAGETADQIINPNDEYWPRADQLMAQAGATNAQVQVIWLKEAIDYGYMPQVSFPTDAQNLQTDLAQILTILEGKYPNLHIVYLAGRTYGGYASVPLNPDGPPQGQSYYAYDSGFAVKWLIQDRIDGVTSGPEWLAWGPYLWADGTIPRSDGLQWLCTDFRPTDGTHPSPSGVTKVATMLLDFFHGDPTASPWYLAGAGLPTPMPCPRRRCR